MRISDWSSDVCSSDLGWMAKNRLEQVVTGHGSEPLIDLPAFTLADPVYSRLHIVEYTTLRHAAQHPECMRQRIEQHFVGLKQVGSRDGSVANMGHGRAASPSWGIRQHWRNAY